MVEFALIGPLFFLFVVVIIQGALYINAQATIDNMTREVARAVAVCGTTPGPWTYRDVSYSSCDAAALAQRNLNFLPVSGSVVTVAVCTDSASLANSHCPAGAAWAARTSVGQLVEVTTYYTYKFYLDPLLGSGSPSIQIQSSARVVTQQ